MRKQQCGEGLLMQWATCGMTWHAEGCPVSRGECCVHKPVPGAGTSTVMAELVRQVTSSCAERGRALAATWNLHVGLTDALTGALAMSSISFLDPSMILQLIKKHHPSVF